MTSAKSTEVSTGVDDDATALLYGYLNHAATFYGEGHATRDSIDTAMRLGCGLPCGPLETLDRIGLDRALAALTDLRDTTGDDMFAPAPALVTLVDNGRLGRSARRGFFDYTADADADATTDVGSGANGSADTPRIGNGGVRIRRVGVVGSGVMARGIVEVAAVAGFATTLVARSPDSADAARAAITSSVDAAVRRGRITEAAATAALSRLDYGTDLCALASADLIIEAIVEDLPAKQAMFASIGTVCGADAILATTTSSLPVAGVTAPAGRATNVVGTHFFNPVPAMKLVELVPTSMTCAGAADAARRFCTALGKTTVDCPDRPGFIVNLLLFPYLGNAVRLLDRPGRTVEQVDDAIIRKFGFPLGPFALLDTIGLDVSLAIQRRLYATFANTAFAPPDRLVALVEAGWLGRKNGRGFRTPHLV